MSRAQGLGDGKQYPVAYLRLSLTASENDYSASELETLVVVWAMSHFHSYRYGPDVTVYTDVSAVKAILMCLSP